jgi:aspartyl/asparaginyl beta-hydroxylase (cupin superfamily)
VIITRLDPGKQIYPHRDVLGKYANFYTRYHVPLQSDPGVIFACGDETVQMQAGEAWWFNGHIDHAVINNSSRDRLNLIVDVRC